MDSDDAIRVIEGMIADFTRRSENTERFYRGDPVPGMEHAMDDVTDQLYRELAALRMALAALKGG